MFVDRVDLATARTILEWLEQVRRAGARRPASPAGRRDGPRPGRCDRVRAPRLGDHGQRRRLLRGRRGSRRESALGARSSRAPCSRTIAAPT